MTKEKRGGGGGVMGYLGNDVEMERKVKGERSLQQKE